MTATMGFWNVIVAVAQGVWNVIKAAWSMLWSVITALFLTFTAIFTGHWGKAWNAWKDAAAAVFCGPADLDGARRLTA